MELELTFPVRQEKHSVRLLKPSGMEVFLDFPVWVSHLNGSTDKVRYDQVEEQKDGTCLANALIRARNGNEYELCDLWRVEENCVTVERRFSVIRCRRTAQIRVSTDFDCVERNAVSFDDYRFVIPGAFYGRNDTDDDGVEDYQETFQQDYKDDRNPGLSVLCYLPAGKAFLALLRNDKPVRDCSITREQIQARHFVHDTDIGSMGFAPSMHRGNGVSLHVDYPFCERNSFCLNIDGSGWSAYREMKEGESFAVSYSLLFGGADTLTDASWQVTSWQMDRLLNDRVPLPFTLEEARRERREMIFNSFREFPDHTGNPAGFFIHFSPRQRYGTHHLLEYGFSGAQTLNCFAMLSAAEDGCGEEYRRRALKTLDFFVDYCIDRSGLPNGIYDVDHEKFVYWWTGVLLPYQYTNSRKELEGYLGEQVVGALSAIAEKLKENDGNYCRTMCEAMRYLLLCYEKEKKAGHNHSNWLTAVKVFCDRLLTLQNENGSWCRGYTMAGKPLTQPPEWFGGSETEIGSGALFPAEVLIPFYRLTGDKRYLEASVRAARFILRHYVPEVRYVGGLNDTTHKKSIKIDAVGVMFAMRTLLLVYEETGEDAFLMGARDAARILASWTYMWNIPFDAKTLLGQYGFQTTGWTGCDVIPACSYVDDEFVEFIPDLLRIAELCGDRRLAVLGRIVTRGMHHGLSMPQVTYGYPMMGVQCEGFLTSLWLSDTTSREFAGATCKNKGDDNDTVNGLINAQALYNLDYLAERFGTLDFDQIQEAILNGGRK